MKYLVTLSLCSAMFLSLAGFAAPESVSINDLKLVAEESAPEANAPETAPTPPPYSYRGYRYRPYYYRAYRYRPYYYRAYRYRPYYYREYRGYRGYYGDRDDRRGEVSPETLPSPQAPDTQAQ